MSAAALEHVSSIPYIRQRSWATAAIVFTDIVALELALLLGCLTRFAFQPLLPIHLGREQYAGLALGVLTLPLMYLWVGLYPGYGMGSVERLRSRVYSTFTVFIVLLTWNYVFQANEWSRGVLVSTMVFALVIPPIFEALLRHSLVARGICGVPVVILGGGQTGTQVARQLTKQRDLGFVPVAVLDDDSAKWGTQISGVPVIGSLKLVHHFHGRARVVLIAMPKLAREKLADLIQSLSFPHIILVPDLVGIQSMWINSRDLGGILGLEVRKNLLIPTNRIMKRFMDYAIAIPMAILTLPFLLLCAAWIKVVSPGPALFRQVREGKHGRPITILKLRTMHPDAERLLAEYLESNPDERATWRRFYKLKKDPRIIPGVGSFLRRYSLDELPQLWNVIQGDMSLVGPRPFPLYHLDIFPPNFRALRASVNPGLTGLWQVSDRSDGDVNVQETEDTYYIRNWSLWLDCFILVRTIQTVLLAKGAY